MTKVSFYILPHEGPTHRQQLACRLCEKAWDRSLATYIATTDNAQAQQMDDLLWTFRDGSFIPHNLVDQHDGQTNIAIGTGEPPSELHDLLINLGTAVPDWFSRFERVAEIIDSSNGSKATGRERYRWYRDRGYEIETHTL